MLELKNQMRISVGVGNIPDFEKHPYVIIHDEFDDRDEFEIIFNEQHPMSGFVRSLSENQLKDFANFIFAGHMARETMQNIFNQQEENNEPIDSEMCFNVLKCEPVIAGDYYSDLYYL